MPAETVGLDDSFDFFSWEESRPWRGLAGGFYAGQVVRPGFYAGQECGALGIEAPNYVSAVLHSTALTYSPPTGLLHSILAWAQDCPGVSLKTP